MERCGRTSFRTERPADILDEVAAVTPIYGGVSFARLDKESLQWPCRDASDPGTPFLHKDTFSRGLGKFHATPFREAAELPDEEYPLVFSTGRLLFQFHTGTLSRRSPGIEEVAPPGNIEIHPDDAQRMRIQNGEPVRVTSRRGEVEAKAFVTPRVREGMVFMPFHYSEAPANVLTNDALDAIAMIPELKVCAVRVEKSSAPRPRRKRRRRSRASR